MKTLLSLLAFTAVFFICSCRGDKPDQPSGTAPDYRLQSSIPFISTARACCWLNGNIVYLTPNTELAVVNGMFVR